jgi:hypothetical protein
VQVTAAIEVPAPVVDPTFQVQDKVPVLGALRDPASPLALETVPERYVTLAVQDAPDTVWAVMVAFAPGVTDSGKEVIETEKVAPGARVADGGVAVGVTVDPVVGTGPLVVEIP